MNYVNTQEDSNGIKTTLQVRVHLFLGRKIKRLFQSALPIWTLQFHLGCWCSRGSDWGELGRVKCRPGDCQGSGTDSGGGAGRVIFDGLLEQTVSLTDIQVARRFTTPTILTRNSDSVFPNTAVNRSFAFFSTMKKSAKNKYSLQLLSNNVKCMLRNRLSNEYCKTRNNENS